MITIKTQEQVFSLLKEKGPLYLAVLKPHDNESIQANNCHDIIYVNHRQPFDYIEDRALPMSFAGRWNNHHPEPKGLQIMLDQYTESGYTIVYEDEPAIRFMLKHKYNQDLNDSVALDNED